MASASPRITSLLWGRIEVEGLGEFKDAKLWPGGGREWDWNETGTGHAPGVQPADVDELLDHGAEVIVLSRGMQGALEVGPETMDHLAARGIEVHVHATEQAADLYNRLRVDTCVGGLFHSTC
jgi:hypothetical protein